MSFLGKLGKILSIAGPIAATPFTGGTSLLGMAGVGAKIGAGLGALGSVAGGVSAGRAEGRAAEAGVNNTADLTRLDGARFNLQAPQMNALNAGRGDLLAGVQDVNFNRPAGVPNGMMTGGTRPSLLSPQTRQLGQQMSRNALLSQMSGPAFTPTPTPQSGKTDTLLNILGGVGTGIGAIRAAMPAPQQGSVLRPPTQGPSPNVQWPTFGPENPIIRPTPPEWNPAMGIRRAPPSPLFSGLKDPRTTLLGGG